MALAAVAAERALSPVPWSLLFAKAFALVATQRPELRRAAMNWPWPHLYECEQSCGSMALEREYEGEPAVFFGLIHDPANQSLSDLQQRLNRWKTEPVESISDFRKVIWFSGLPWWMRRLVWWYADNFSGRVRAHNFGTFGISITASTGATALNLIAPVASILNYGPFDSEYRLDVRLHFDHRVYDGMTAARVLAEIEEVLNSDLLQELAANRQSPSGVPRL